LKHRLVNLDLVRGVAALMVCVSHLRAFLLVDFGKVAAPTVVDRVFYFSTGMGHQAVVIFFVLSGYLVGGSVLTAYQSGRWSWMNYALRRLSRLWMVLLPALVLTWALDSLGRHLGYAGYEGAWFSVYNSGPAPATPADLRATTFLGNVFFLQTIQVRCYGTNGPLWSLANEFWYYALFPLICSAAVVRSLPIRLVCSLLALALIWWLPGPLVWSGLIWLMGVGAYWAGQFEGARRICRHPAWLIVAGGLVLGSLAASKTGSWLGTDWSIGVVCSLWIVGLASCEHHLSWLRNISTGLSEMSYTLYVVHFPILAFVFFCWFRGQCLFPGVTGYLWFGALLTGTMAIAAVLWWCFERNTDRVRKSMERLIHAGVAPTTAGSS
jgi:peptidoglycan/LPS O-acetylase OafA/YrhL